MTLRTLLLALSLAVLPGLAALVPGPATASMEQMATLKGRLVGITATSLAVIDENSGKVVHFMLEAPFEDAFSANEKVQIPMNDLRMNSLIRVEYDQNRGGPRRAERIIILKSP
jgi:hypothetical protein